MKLAEIIQNRFFIASEKDELLGEKVILVIESFPLDDKSLLVLKHQMKSVLSTYEIPKSIYCIPHFIATDTKKIQRLKTLDLMRNLPENY
jgi:O-succinylbenzoic acid--CoA ligase